MINKIINFFKNKDNLLTIFVLISILTICFDIRYTVNNLEVSVKKLTKQLKRLDK